jgi:hypothetical protein
MLAMSRKQVRPDRLPQTQVPIKYLTENGFSIVRVSEIDPSVIDTPTECHFLVQYEDEAPCEVTVGLTDELTARLRLRRRLPLSDRSTFWVVVAEHCLAEYLWEKNECPSDRRLTVNELSPDDLMLALHWRDRE